MENSRNNVTAIILASGESKRMGMDKLLLEYKGKTIIQHVIETVAKVAFKEIIVVCRNNYIKLIAEKLGATVLINQNYEKGQSESIKLALENINDKTDFMFFVGDIPLIKVKTIEDMIKKFNERKGILVAKSNGNNTNPVIFQWRFKEELLKLQGDVGGKIVIHNNKQYLSYYEIENKYEVMDIDTLEDYKALKCNPG